ncbi:uncharacterized protein LOC105848395 isoform X1 [Hydra vulgaris]|uniref:uncharacterized protein LOC105848395 isoform X1 n=1 Tax=Hydra vulgaris TaxID=6087 RepID=UPI001F5F7B41|nr:uncharacterized protein LOC105848395 [Hydra vulgaris]
MLSLSIKNCWGVASLRQSVGFPACEEYEYFAPLGSCIVCWNIVLHKKVLQFQAHSDLIVVMSKSKADFVLTVSYCGEIKLWTKNFDYICGCNFPSNNVIFGTWSECSSHFAVISNSPKSMIVVYSIKCVTDKTPVIEQVMEYMAPLATDIDAKVIKCCFSFCVFYYRYIIVIYQTEKTSDIYKICLQTNDTLTVRIRPLGDDCNGIYCLSEIKKNMFALGLNQGIFAIYNADTLDLISIILACGSPQVCMWYGECLLTVSYLSGKINLWSTDGMLIQEYKDAPTGSIVSVQQSLHNSSSIWVGGIMSLHYITLSESCIQQSLDLSFHMVTGCGIDISSEEIVASGDFTGQVLLWQNDCELPIKKHCFTNSVRCLLWCDDILLIGLLDGQMYQWKLCNENFEPAEVYNFIGGVVSIKANHDRRKLAVGTTRGFLYIFSLQLNNGFLKFDILYCNVQHAAKHANNQSIDMEIWSLTWSPDNNQIATASEDQTCLINDSENGKILHVLIGHSSAVTSVGWKILSSSKNILVTCADDQTARVYDGISFQFLKVLDTYELYGWHTLTYIVIDVKKDFLLISTQNGYVVVWNLRDYKCYAKYKLHSGSIEGLVIDKDHILTIGSDCVVNNFSIKEGALVTVLR